MCSMHSATSVIRTLHPMPHLDHNNIHCVLDLKTVLILSLVREISMVSGVSMEMPSYHSREASSH